MTIFQDADQGTTPSRCRTGTIWLRDQRGISEAAVMHRKGLFSLIGHHPYAAKVVIDRSSTFRPTQQHKSFRDDTHPQQGSWKILAYAVIWGADSGQKCLWEPTQGPQKLFSGRMARPGRKPWTWRRHRIAVQSSHRPCAAPSCNCGSGSEAAGSLAGRGPHSRFQARMRNSSRCLRC